MSKVFANNREISHAKATGKSINFPCVGKTPGPPAPFVPVPYPNISMASDTAEGAKKVTAQGNEVALKNTSNFSTSKGNEAASAGGGLVTSKQMGKSSYMMYSMDVKVEGAELPRAFDIMAGDS